MKRMFILSSQSLYSRGVEILLRQDKGIEFVGEETDKERAIQRIAETEPDVVLLEHDLKPDLGVLVMQILEAAPSTKIIGLNLVDKTIRVYRSELRTTHEIGDLLQVIKGDPCRDEPARPNSGDGAKS